jgi:hypothetical protein
LTITRRVFKSASEMPQDAPAEPAGEPTETGAADVTPAAETPLSRAQIALQETAEQLKALSARRREALLTGTDDDVAVVDAEIEATQRLQRTRSDRVSVLLEQAAEEAAFARAAEREARIVETERLFIERDAAVADLKDHLVGAEQAFQRIHQLNLQARAAWEWPHGRVGGALLAASDLVRETASFIYRISGRPPQTGGEFRPDVPPSLPGGKCPRIEWLQTPNRLPDLVAQYRLASKYGSDVMRGVRGDVPAPASPASPGVASPGDSASSNVEPLPTVSPIRAEPNAELSRLLMRQNQLASRQMSDEDEAEYAANGRLIAAIS